MKKLLVLIFVLAGCASKQDYREDKQMQEEEINRTSESDDIGPGYNYGTTSSPD